MHARRETAQRMLLLVGRDLHEAELVRRLLPARVGIAHAPSQAVRALRLERGSGQIVRIVAGEVTVVGGYRG